MRKLFILTVFTLILSEAFAQSAKVRSIDDGLSNPEIDNLSGYKPEGDDLKNGFDANVITSNFNCELAIGEILDITSAFTIEQSVEDLNLNKKQIVTAEDISIYPNPASEFIIISSNVESAKISILNLVGQVVLSSNLTNEQSKINIASLKEGIYFVCIENSDFKIVKKIKVIN